MKDINEIIVRMTNDLKDNKKIFLEYFDSLDYCDNNANSLLHLIIKSNTNLRQKLLACTTLIDNGIDVNKKNKFGNTFIHEALYHKYDINFIMDMLLMACHYNYDVNTTNAKNFTIFHSAICYVSSFSDLMRFATWLNNNNFDFSNKDAVNIHQFIYKSKNLSVEQKNKLINFITEANGKKRTIGIYDKFNKHMNNNKGENNANFDVSKYGRILNDIDYLSPPATGRENEIYNIIVSLAQDKKTPLLVGPSGVGKTSTIDQLVYMIKKKIVPDFLKDKKIYEVSAYSIVAGTTYRGDLEKNMKEILDYCVTNNIILFIDEFHSIYGSGSTRDNPTDIASIIKNYIDRYGLKVIGATTTFEYDKYMADSALKRRFDVVKIEEPNDKLLYEIIMNTFTNMASIKEIGLDNEIISNIDEIINILIELTSSKKRTYYDEVNNPDLVISIIDKAFAYALVNNDDMLKLSYLTASINQCERIYDYSRNEAINELNQLAKYSPKVYKREKIIDFCKYKNKY